MLRWAETRGEERLRMLCRLAAPLQRLLRDSAVRAAFSAAALPGESAAEGLLRRVELAEPGLRRLRADFLTAAALLTGTPAEGLGALPERQAALLALDCVDADMADFLHLLRRHGAERCLSLLTALRRWPGMEAFALLLRTAERQARQQAWQGQLLWLSARALHHLAGVRDWPVPDWFSLFPAEAITETAPDLAERFRRRLGAGKETEWTETEQSG